ncbi:MULTISPECIES: type I-E CRISPR-associated protein Cas6/Cse3/CasE [Streptomyces]|uniref:type I-E CRISPR-associated protein Cas6/Cse3/CasE n=1 Tax=Streptomyces TaxID=1883 RepID=UPI001587D060|nr:type I-E CRISPR-associated protein Cas6/Cse3/CasE [Streptomyces sp. CAI-155]NUV80241.1 type I-E CRISPR-associated protein Cas6/Cse3/CasE [Streptomyces sp. CAI-155]
MYLTRFRVNTHRSDARRLLGSPHRLHGAVNASFPTPPSREGSGPRVLWRVDRNTDSETLLYIVSPGRPDLTHLVEQAGWPASDEPGWATFSYADFLTALHAGDTWGFRLTANPVHNIRHQYLKEGERTKRAAHRTPRHQMRWLLERQERAGFEIVQKPEERRLLPVGDEYELVVRDQIPLQFHRPQAGKEPRTRAPGRADVQITKVTFDGRLRVTEPALFRRTLTHGLGKAKAYGCGLMTLAPVRGEGAAA